MNAQDQLNQIRTASGKTSHQVLQKQKSKNVLVAIVMTMTALLSVVFLFYAFSEKQRADELQTEVELLKTQLQECQKQ